MKNRISAKFFGALMTGLVSTTALAADPPPSTTPAPIVAAATLRSAPRVEVFPFMPISTVAQDDWTGRGIQENLQSDISRTGATLLLGPRTLASTDDPTAIARQNHADLAVTGSYQVVGDQIRANGHVIDVATNATVGGFTATGSQHDLFKVEDALGEQLRALLPRPMAVAQAQQAVQQFQPTTVYEPPVQIETPQPSVNYYYDNTPPASTYIYPDDGYGYEYPLGIGVYGGFGYVSPGYYGSGYYNRGFENRSHYSGNTGFRGSTGVGRSPGFGGGSRGGGGGFHGGGGGGGGGSRGGGGRR